MSMSDSLSDPLLIISGPTASGKSSLATILAKELLGEIVNLDSVQIYRHADVGSAKASQREQKDIRHHLIDIRDPDQWFSVADYVSEADKVTLEITKNKRIPIFVGGTTMYLASFLHGLKPLPSRSVEIRNELEAAATSELYSRLQERDPVRSSQIHMKDRVRIIRALEVSISPNNREDSDSTYNKEVDKTRRSLILLPMWPREILYERINKRSDKLVSEGIVNETLRIIEGYGENVRVLSTLGYKQSVQYIKGELTYQELVSQIATATRRYAKRQLTFWRNEGRKRGWRSIPQQSIQNGPVKSGISEDFLTISLTLNELISRVKDRLTSKDWGGVEVWYIDAQRCIN